MKISPSTTERLAKKWPCLALLFFFGTLSHATAQTSSYIHSGNHYRSSLRSPVYGVETENPCVSKTGNTIDGIPAGSTAYLGAPLADSHYLGQYYAAAGSDVPESSLTPGTPVQVFRSGPASGFLYDEVVTFANVPPDMGSATVQLRAWDNSSGLYPDWAAAEPAWEAGLIAAGMSLPFNVLVRPLPADPDFPWELRSFNIYFRSPCAGQDIGLRAYDGTQTIRIECELPNATGQVVSPLRITKNGTTYGITLVPIDSPRASKFRIQTPSGVKAWAKIP
jgi:hypothetical protein